MNDLGKRVDAFGRPVPEPEQPSAPQSLQVARWLWIGSVLIGFVQTFTQLVNRPGLIAELRRLEPNLTQQDLEAAANSVILFTFLLKGMLLLIFALLTRRMLEGRNWARIVLTVFGGFGICNALLTVLVVSVVSSQLIQQLAGTPITGADVAFSLVVMVVEVAAIVFMYQAESNRFFRDKRNPGHAPISQGNGSS